MTPPDSMVRSCPNKFYNLGFTDEEPRRPCRCWVRWQESAAAPSAIGAPLPSLPPASFKSRQMCHKEKDVDRETTAMVKKFLG